MSAYSTFLRKVWNKMLFSVSVNSGLRGFELCWNSDNTLKAKTQCFGMKPFETFRFNRCSFLFVFVWIFLAAIWEQSSVVFYCQLRRCSKSDQIISVSSEQLHFDVWHLWHQETKCEEKGNWMVWSHRTKLCPWAGVANNREWCRPNMDHKFNYCAYIPYFQTGR